MSIEEDLKTDRKIVVGHIDRVHRKVKKLMKEQMAIRRQIYKLDNKLDVLIWDLSQDVNNQSLIKKKDSYDKRLSALMEQKGKNNISLKKYDDKLTIYNKRLFETNLKCE